MSHDIDTAIRNAAPRATLHRNTNPDEPMLSELIAVLTPHARGLRRWSVMRAIRANRSRLSQAIPQKFEEQVERTFRRFCADAADAGSRACALEDARFYRPRETAGEVWALVSERSETAAQAAE